MAEGLGILLTPEVDTAEMVETVRSDLGGEGRPHSDFQEEVVQGRPAG